MERLVEANAEERANLFRQCARAREYEDALLWLGEAGMVQRCFNVSCPGIPLSAYRDISAFKVYACDCGLLRRLARVSPEVILGGNANYTEFRGALAENAVLQSLLPQCEDTPCYWSADGRAEVDFLLPLPTEAVPVEVKSERRISGKSLSVYAKKYQPSRRVRFSMNNLQQNDGLLSCPLPLADWSIRLLAMCPSTAKETGEA